VATTRRTGMPSAYQIGVRRRSRLPSW